MNKSYLTHIKYVLPQIGSEEEFNERLSSTTWSMPEQLSLEDFDARKHVSDRRMLKAISHRDSYSIAAVEQLKAVVGPAQNPERLGMFVGACPSSMRDYDNYLPAVKKCVDLSGQYNEERFGGECMTSRPTTLLLGLPNNVLCYGSMLLEAHGPNNNFVSEGVSAMQALKAAQRALQRDQIDVAYVGGYTEQNDPVKKSAQNKLGWTEGRQLSDGAAFLAMTSDGGDHNVQYIDTVFRSAAAYLSADYGAIVLEAVQDIIERHDLMATQIKYIFVPEQRWLDNDTTIGRKLSATAKQATLISLSEKFGYLAEVSGLIELAAIDALKRSQIDTVNAGGQQLSSATINAGVGLILTCSLDGDIAVSLVN